MRGLPTSAVATARRCFWPPESLPTQASDFSVSSSSSRTSAAGRGSAVETGEQFDGLADVQLFGEARFLERNADPFAQLARIFVPGVAEDADFAGGRREQAFEDFDGRRLPCSVRTEQAEALAGFDLQAEAADGFDFAVVGLAQVGALDRGSHWCILARFRRAIAVSETRTSCQQIARWIVAPLLSVSPFGIAAVPLASCQRIAFSFLASTASGLEKFMSEDCLRSGRGLFVHL